MEKLYRITPLEKKSVEYFIDVFERLEDGSCRGFEAHFYYRWGQGFREEDNQPWDFEVENGVNCNPTVGWGCELDDLCGVDVRFDENFTKEEMTEIRALCTGEAEDDEGRFGEGWIYDGDHNWEIEDDCVYIHRPLQIDLVSEDGDVIQENVGTYKEDTEEELKNQGFE